MRVVTDGDSVSDRAFGGIDDADGTLGRGAGDVEAARVGGERKPGRVGIDGDTGLDLFGGWVEDQNLPGGLARDV